MKVRDIISQIEKRYPPSLQENYDNSGLLVGSTNTICKSVLITVDVTENIVDEAIEKECQLIIAHHPIIFSGIKRLNGSNWVEKTLIKAIKNDISIYAVHTNLDNMLDGTNHYLAKKLGLINLTILRPMKRQLMKIVVFCPKSHSEAVRKSMFEAGAGEIGNYDQCSFNAEGSGSFRAGQNTSPFVGEIGQVHFEAETRIETVFPAYLKGEIINAMLAAHPYEEVAYDIFSLENKYEKIGAGIIGQLTEPQDETKFLAKLKKICSAEGIRHTELLNKPIKNIAICGGSGAFLIEDAKRNKADFYITGDVKYHEFFEADRKLVIADIGHYESEQFTKEILYDLLKEKFPTFAFLKSDRNTNPINYL